MMIVRVENMGRTAIKVPSKVYLMADPGVPLELHPNCIDLDKARAVPNLKVTVINTEPAVEPAQVVAAPAVEEPELPEEVPPVVVEIDKLVRDTDLQEVPVSAHNAEAASGTRKRGRPRKTEE